MKIDEDKVPATFEEAVVMAIAALTENDLDHIKNAGRDSTETHFNVGMYLRNSWSMWDTDTPLNKDFQKRFGLFGHGDDVSGLLWHCIFNRVRGQPDDTDGQVEQFRRHWQKYSVDPATGKHG